MAMIAAGLPFIRPIMLYVWAPSSIRATSLRRTMDPSGFARTTIASNSTLVISRPCARTV